MPLFFLISGIFHKNTGNINWESYCQVLLWPSLICISIYILNGLIFSPNSLKYYLEYFFIDMLKGDHEGVYWFILALFWCKVFMDICIRVGHPRVLFFFWAMLLFAPVLLNIRLPLEMTQALMAFPFYYVGYKLSAPLQNTKRSYKYLFTFTICLFITVLITRFHGRVSMMSIHFGQLAHSMGFEPMALSIPKRLSFLGVDIVLFYLNGIIGSALVLSLALLPLPEYTIVSKLSKCLITTFGTQYIFINHLVRFVGLDNPLWFSAILSVIIFGLCYFTHSVLNPIYKIVR